MSAKLPTRSDIVIIGGGIMGTSVAYFLSKKSDKDVVLLEKDNIASGSTGNSSAILRHQYGAQEIYSRMAAWGHDFYRNFEAATGEPLARTDNPHVGTAENDTIDASLLLEGHDIMNSLDISANKLDAEALQARFPEFNFGDIDFGVVDDDAGYSDGTDAANGFARAAQRHGSTILTGVEVTDFTVDNDSITGIQTNQGEVLCDQVLISAGPWTPRLAENLDVHIPIEVEREQVVILEPRDEHVDDIHASLPTGALPGGDLYVRPDFGGGILVATHHTGEHVNPDHYSNQPEEDMLLEMTGLLERAIPELADAKIKGQYCGVYSTTPDHDFIIGEIGPSDCYVACGFSGHGFKHGPAVGKILSDLMTKGSTDLVDIDLFAPSRFQDSPEGNSGPVRFK